MSTHLWTVDPFRDLNLVCVSSQKNCYYCTWNGRKDHIHSVIGNKLNCASNIYQQVNVFSSETRNCRFKKFNSVIPQSRLDTFVYLSCLTRSTNYTTLVPLTTVPYSMVYSVSVNSIAQVPPEVTWTWCSL